MSFWDYAMVAHLQGVIEEERKTKKAKGDRNVPEFEQPLSESFGPQFVDAPEMKPEDLFSP